MTHHPTDPGLIAQGGSEAAGTDILARARRVLDGKATPSASLCMELVVEVERLRGALKRVQASAENGAGAGILQCDFINVYVQAVLRGDQ